MNHNDQKQKPQIFTLTNIIKLANMGNKERMALHRLINGQSSPLTQEQRADLSAIITKQCELLTSILEGKEIENGFNNTVSA